MDVAKTLIRTTVRAFYDTRCALVVDALFIHSVSVAPNPATPPKSHIADPMPQNPC